MRLGTFAFAAAIAMLALLGLTLCSNYGGASLALAGQRGERLHKYESDDGKFRVEFPERPKKDVKELSLGSGMQTVNVKTIRAEGPNGSVFAVIYTDYPESYRQVPAKSIIDGVRDGLLGKDGTKEKDEEVVIGTGSDKLTGREIRIVAGKRIVHTRVFVEGTRLYQVMVTGTRGRLPEKTVAAFHKSFEMVK